MTIEEFRHLLVRALSAIDDPQARGELSSLIEQLSAIDGRSLPEFAKAIAPAIAKLSKPSKASTKKPPKAATQSITNYLDELNAVRDDNAAFEAIIARLDKDRTFKVADAKELAARFTGQATAFKTKKDALKAVLQRQIVDKRTADRAPQISGLF